MTDLPLRFANPVTLVGGGTLARPALDAALSIAPHLVAADGAADVAAAHGLQPEAIVGDMDSLADPAAWADRGVPMIEIAEQDSTDFEKCLTAIEAPFFLGVGFTGRRTDHTLAVFHAMLARADRPVVLVGEDDVIALVPPRRRLDLSLRIGAWVSLFPLCPVTGQISEGLRWPVDGLSFCTGAQIGTSNEAVAPDIALGVDAPGLLIMLQPEFLQALLRGLGLARAR
ncbi:MAG: thiamine diphosphokinase [Pseudomonadota bacterium]